MSFIDLMASTIWSEADIVRRTEEIVHGQFPVEAEVILHRKVTAAVIGQYTLTPAEQMDVGRYAQVCEAARQEGDAARADMALLTAAMAVEAAQRRLSLPEIEDGEQDAAERVAAQAVVDAAGPDVLALVALRNPVVET